MKEYKHSSWAGKVLENMQKSGRVGEQKAAYLVLHDVKFVTKVKGANNAHWGSKWGWRGLQMDNTIHYPLAWERRSAHDPWALSAFVHETVHLEQGILTALSVYGELQAWQVGFRYYLSLTDAHLSREVVELLDLPLNHDREVLKRAKRLIIQDQNADMTGFQAVTHILLGRKKFKDFYWIYPLPLKPWKD